MESYGHQLLLKISRLLKNENLCLHLRQAATQEELYHVFMEGMQTPLSIAA
jgi:mannitol/fructose-specific phosphotransferase system IIA component (Ntr-type)